MAERWLTAEIAELLDAHVGSIEALTVALFMRRYGWQRLPAAFIAEGIGSDLAQVAPALERLTASGLVGRATAPEEFYLRGGPAMLRTLDRLADAYQEDPLVVVRYVASRAIERMRQRAARFAVTLRPDDDDSER